MLPRDLRVNFKDPLGGWRFFRKTPEFLVRVRPFPAVRFAVTVSIKVAKKSNRRNLLKRRTKSVILKNFGRFKTAVKVKNDYWISILPPANNLSKKEFEEKLIKILF